MFAIALILVALVTAVGTGAWYVHSVRRGAPWAMELARAQAMLPSPTAF